MVRAHAPAPPDLGLTVDCRLCGEPIGPEQFGTAVYVNTPVPGVGIKRNGPFHGECGKAFAEKQG